jgi:ABC-type dipeptide/oligopeptide/nickel transport system permease component
VVGLLGENLTVYAIRRVGWAVVLLWLVTVFTFVLTHVIPGNPALFLAGLSATKAQVHALYVELGLDKPLFVQYGEYLWGLLHLNLGTSDRTGNPVTVDLAHYLPATVELVIVSFVIYVLLAVPLGAWAARQQGRIIESVVRVSAIVGSGMPVFWLGALFQAFFFAHLGVLPEGGELGITAPSPPPHTGIFLIDSSVAGQWGTFGQTVVHLVLPVATIVIAMLAVGLRSTRASVLLELRRPYVRTAEAKGVSGGRLVGLHVMKNALNPVISILALQFGYLLGWIVLVETVFNWPGIGLYLYDSIQSFDYAPIMAITLLISATFIFVNLVADLLYPVLDPRLRDRGGA